MLALQHHQLAKDRSLLVVAVGLACLVFVAFLPTLNAELLTWDDLPYVTENPLLRDVRGLKAIWDPRTQALLQYYPLTFTSYWIEYQLWGLSSYGYHITNVMLHVINVWLVLGLAGALGASHWASALAAGVFAVHPVQVESVAWVAERKNTLSTAFYLAALLAYLRHRRRGNWVSYAIALIALLAALLSKTQTLMLPAVLALTEWILQKHGRIRALSISRVLARLAPMLALGLLATLVTAQLESRREIPATELPLLWQRPLVAATSAGFYVKTFLIPVGLTPIYPKWPITATDLIPWLALLGWPIVLTLLVKWRDRLPTLCVWGVAQFLISLLPIVGLAPFNYQAQSYVGDHFLYLSCIGGGLALASCAEAVVQRRRQPARVLALALTVVLVATYAILTHLYSRHWRTNHAFWTHAYESNPNNYWANTELGMLYEAKGDLQQAIGFYRRAVDLFADNAMAFSRYLLAVARLHGAQAAVDSCNRKLAENPPYAGTVHVLRGLMYERLGNKAAAAEDYDAGLRLSRPGSQTWRTARRRLRVLRSP